jgi:hypothetical protein
MRALAHPLRLRMMELFAESPKTTKQVAELLGEPPTRLYHHVAALERAGLLVLKETRQNRGAIEKWFTAVSQQMQSGSGTPGKSGMSRAARRALATTVLEQAKQEIAAVPRGAGEPALLARLIVTAPRRKIAAIRKQLFAAVQSLRSEYAREADEPGGQDCERWAITMAFAPVTSPARGRRRKP